MKLTRRTFQIAFLFLFLTLFVLTVGRSDWSSSSGMSLKSPAPVDFFLKIDPLLSISAMAASRQFLTELALWSLPVLILAVLFGRAFCGWVCPLGTMIDIFDRMVRHGKPRDTRKEISNSRLKYYILAGLLATALSGAQLVWFFDPMALAVRGLTLAVFAPVNIVFSYLVTLPVIGSAAKPMSALFPESAAYFRASLAALIIFGLILSGGILARRFWCRTLCPLGAMLGLIARIPLFRRSVSSACSECTLCRIDCKMDAVSDKGNANDSAECIYCYSCVSLCRKDAVKIAHSQPESKVPLDLSRRQLLAGIGLGAAWGFSAASGLGHKTLTDGSSYGSKRLIRPPGSISEKLFTERCVRCGECMKVCPTNGLQPSISEGDIYSLWTPVLIPRIGECTQQCNLCGQVCPTDAIQPFDISEKEHLYIGRAEIHRSACVVWVDGKQCLVCDEVCSYDAIYWKIESGAKRPFVDEARCVGCGICERHCPVGGSDAAIRVSSSGDKRSETRDQQKQWRQHNLKQRQEPTLIQR